MASVISRKDYVIGIDIGGTKTLIALVNELGNILSQIEFPTLPEHGLDHMILRLQESVERLKELIPEDGALSGIGIVSAGVIDSEKKTIVYAANLGWHNADVGSILEQTFNVPVMLGNDANLAAVAEYVWGVKKQVTDLIYITVSTGIGSGIVSGGQLVQGVSDSAGELGHISMNPFGEKCGCGNVGCLENYCSGTAIASIANKRLAAHPSGAWSSKDVMEAANKGDEAAIAIIKEAGFYLGHGIVSIIHLFNPAQIILGGGVMSSDNMLYEEAQRIIEQHCLPELKKKLTIRKTTLGKEIGVLGAAGLFFMNTSSG